MEFSSVFQDFRERLNLAADPDMFPLVKEAWDFQLRYNTVLREFVDRCGRPRSIERLDDITFLPIEFFKTHRVVTGQWTPESYFQSSGTQGSTRSKHWMDNLSSYRERTFECFDSFDPTPDLCHFFFLPFYEANDHSSLISMASAFVNRIPESGSGFYKDLISLQHDLKRRSDNGQLTYVWSVSYGLMDFYETFPSNYPNTIFIETGGMKGNRQEVPKSILHANALSALPDSLVSSEYGMCELSSQSYMSNGWFSCPKGMDIIISEPQDPFHQVGIDRRGVINVIDLYNIHSCSFIQTQDLGIVRKNGFQVLGRNDDSAIRGCNLMYGDII